MNPEPQPQHRWLQKLVGEWTYESECVMGPDQPAMKHKGSESVRSLGGLWTIGNGQGEMPDGDVFYTIMTLGFDPKLNRFVGTFVGSMMTYLWTYNGSLDAAEKALTLDADGPNFTTGEMTKYQDIIEFVDDNHRILRSQTIREDGGWQQFMTAHYRRTK